MLSSPPAPFARRAVRWSTCALTGQPLAAPIAADWLGNLFNRAAALEFLLGRAAIFADDAAQVCLLCQMRHSIDLPSTSLTGGQSPMQAPFWTPRTCHNGNERSMLAAREVVDMQKPERTHGAHTTVHSTAARE